MSLKGTMLWTVLGFLVIGVILYPQIKPKTKWHPGAVGRLAEQTEQECKIGGSFTDANPGDCPQLAWCYVDQLSSRLSFDEYLEMDLTQRMGQPPKPRWIRVLAESMSYCLTHDPETGKELR